MEGNLSSKSEKTIRNDAPGEIQQKEDLPPDGGYGWSYAVFLAHYLQTNTFPGASALEYAFVGGFSISLALIISPVATICVRKYGTQVALFVGIVMQSAGLLGASWASKIWHLFLSQGVAFGFGMGFLFVSSVGVVPQWFTTKRSFANSIASAGSGIGGMVYSLATNAMIQSIGLGWAFRILAIVSCVVNVICALLIRDRNKAVGSVQLAFDWRLFKRTEFLLVLGWGFFSMLGYIVLLFSLPNYARSIGLSAHQGSVIGALLNLGTGIGRPLVGYFSDAAGRINMAGFCTFLAGLFCLVIVSYILQTPITTYGIAMEALALVRQQLHQSPAPIHIETVHTNSIQWVFAKSYGVLIFFAILTGTVSGTFWATIAPVSAEVVGLQVLPSALSITWLVLVIPCTFAEPIGLELRATSGNIYLHAQLFTGFMYIGAAVCAWFLRAWKIGELERVVGGKQEGEREGEIRDDDQVPRGGLQRHGSRVRTLEAAKGLWSWQRV
ncbi:putative transporter [Lachnellula willkommii]|uniref:Putative transporter n=1 Tax=Lachnellula willkommii TaxID=215461 RepID=A0A559M035_9HELO|nr:putative transporter [Lachnellula willkommii]